LATLANVAINSGAINSTSIGATTASTGRFTTLQLPLGATINEFSTDGTLLDNSNTVVPTEAAVKTYVDSKVAAVSIDGLTDGKSDGTSVFLAQVQVRLMMVETITLLWVLMLSMPTQADFFNTANGYFALTLNITGNANTATGESALYANTNGSENTANGVNALYFKHCRKL